MTINIKENELYQEVELFDGDTKVGEAEVEIKGHMLSRFVIYEPYQNKGYGTKLLYNLIQKYDIDNLWVNADNAKAIHLYKKFGFVKTEPTMYEMKLEED